ncbi:hypothetical protein N4R57_03460 [Rhodobacteraceae bacterium D3-12]|nr:hypothetical protein N4R57_03460 [Rhodobacteraceae bacterium D3-12]
MNDLGTKVSRFCEQYFGGLKAACIAADLKYSTLHAQISLEREIPFSTIQRLCDAANVSLEIFSKSRATIGFAAPQTSDVLHRRAALAYSQALREVQDEMRRHGTDILCDDVLNWLHRNNGRLTDFDALRERVDLFELPTPDTKIMAPKRIGQHSLAAQFFNISDTDEYLKKVSSFDPSIIENSLASHWRVCKRQRYDIEDVAISVPVDGELIQGSYRRIVAPVQTIDGRSLTLVFARVLDNSGGAFGGRRP